MAKRKTTSKSTDADRLKWWREARFGMFIHWGLYAVPAGVWKGRQIRGIGEWIMRRAEIPVKVYEKLARQFNPVRFNARQWVKVAADAGMKYIVITSKHHDGFAMFDSPCTGYDIVDATPWGKDPMKALARECRKAGIKLCFYYSQYQDWHAPDGGANDWDFDEDKKDFPRYLRTKVRPQLHELLTQYGPIGLIWFDTPGKIKRPQSLALKRYVHKLQPRCIVSGRVGHSLGDYGSMGDNQIPPGRVEGDWETPATINDTWGFKTADRNWKSVKTLLHLLVDLASKGVNYLLNVGPTAEGIIPKASVDRLRAIGKWMKANGEAIYGTSPNPYPYTFDWGRITAKRGKLYLHVYEWRRKFLLRGLRNRVKGAYLLADRRRKIEVSQSHDKGLDQHALELRLPAKRPDKHVSVVVLEIAGAPDVDESLLQQTDGSVSLPAHMAAVHQPKTGKSIGVGRSGAIEGWRTTRPSLSWEFKLAGPGQFAVKVFTTGPWGKWRGGHLARATVAGKTLRGPIRAHEMPDCPRIDHRPEAATVLGKVRIPGPGTLTLKLRAEKINKAVPDGFMVSSVRLVPVK